VKKLAKALSKKKPGGPYQPAENGWLAANEKPMSASQSQWLAWLEKCIRNEEATVWRLI